VGTAKRERQKARRQERIAAEKAAQQTARRTRSYRRIGILAAIVVALVVLIWLFTRDGGDDAPDEEASNIATVAAGATDDTGECPPADGASDRVTTFSGAWLEALPVCIEEGASYTAALTTSQGATIGIELDAEVAPEAVNAFVILARYGYFDGTPVFQTNDQQFYLRFGHPADGTIAAPGFSVAAGENADADLRNGTVVLSLSGEGAVGASVDILGSETRDYVAEGTVVGNLDSESSPAVDAIIGTHTAGASVVDQSQGNGSPSTPITIESVTITEG
jgi:peptidyl-prolyl cis-trans isomerase B (cyclophilin B)